MLNGFGTIHGYASGLQDFMLPNDYISPQDNGNATLNMIWMGWAGGVDATKMFRYVPGETILRTFAVNGMHPTLSYSLGMDYDPSVIFQSFDTVNHAAVVQTPNSSLHGISVSRMINGVAIYPRNGQTGAGSNWYCGSGTVSASLALPWPNYLTTAGMQPIVEEAMPGNGVYENTAVRTKCFTLQVGTPVSIRRTLMAKDTFVMHQLRLNGVAPRAYVELVDSLTGAVLVKLDSLVISLSTDTLTHDGLLIYTPDIEFTGFPVYVRVRIVADTNTARWYVRSTLEFGGDSTAGGFAKPVFRDGGRGGPIVVGRNEIDLLYYPSPAQPRARIMYTVPDEDQGTAIEVKIFTMLGQDVITLVSDIQSAGRHAVEFDGSHLRPGGYVVAVHTQNHMQSKMIVVQK